MTVLCPECMAAGSKALAQAVSFAGSGSEQDPPARPTVRGLTQHAAAISGLAPALVTGRSRKRAVVDVRRAIAAVARECTALSYPLIGKFMGIKDHSSVLHLCRTAEEKAAREPEFGAFLERLWAAGECEPFGPGVTRRRVIIAEPAVPLLDETPPEPEDFGPAQYDFDTVRGSDRLIAALRREHPERMPECVDFPRKPRRESVRLGYCREVIA